VVSAVGIEPTTY